MEVCPSCGDWASFAVSEVYPELRELVLHACCHENLSGWIAEIASWSRKQRLQWMLYEAGLLVREIVLTEDVLSWTLDYGLRLEPVDFATARDFSPRPSSALRTARRLEVWGRSVQWLGGNRRRHGRSSRVSGTRAAGLHRSQPRLRKGHPATRSRRERVLHALRVCLSRGVSQGILSRRDLHAG